ncbi:MAG: hypothetical protein HKN30_03460 [Sulfitobacter sp.]|nr:hypothetical protein [Sulfitobacter sp.]
MKTGLAIAGVVVVAAVAAAGFYMVDIDQTQETRLPDVEVTVEDGQMPKFDAEVGSVSVGQEEVTVEVPEVNVTMEEETVTVPKISVNPPSDDS